MSLSSYQYTGDGQALATQIKGVGLDNFNIENVRTHLQQSSMSSFDSALQNALVMNTSYASTQFIKNDMELKKLDAEKKEKITRNEISKARYKLMQKQYTINSNNFISGVLQGLLLLLAIITIMICFMRLGKLSSTMAIILSVLLSCIYLFIVLLLVRNNYQRRKDDWTKFYFAPYQPS